MANSSIRKLYHVCDSAIPSNSANSIQVMRMSAALAAPDDVDGVANVLLCLLTDVNLAGQMGLANQEWAEILTWEPYASQQYAIYQTALERHR